MCVKHAHGGGAEMRSTSRVPSKKLIVADASLVWSDLEASCPSDPLPIDQNLAAGLLDSSTPNAPTNESATKTISRNRPEPPKSPQAATARLSCGCHCAQKVLRSA